MKCIELKDGSIKKVSDTEGREQVRSHEAKFIPKKRWKEEVRDKKKE